MSDKRDDDLVSIDEDARRRFEKAIHHGVQVDLAEFLPDPSSAVYQATLEELILIDLEHRWKRVGGQDPIRVESYLERFPIIQDPSSVRRLIEEELRLRVQSGEKPTVVEYRRRFPNVPLDDTFCNLAQRDTVTIGNTLYGDAPGAPLLPPKPDEQRYSIQSQYAAGGMGVIYQAVDETLGRDIAIKQLKGPLGTTQESQARFLNEAKLTSRLQHPGVVPVYDLGMGEDGLPYYAMKLVEGQTLRELIATHFEEDRDESNLRQLLNVLISVANTVAYAHDQGVIHRDLKPANIVVGNYGETVVLDWGLAKDRSVREHESGSELKPTADAELTATGSILGTPAYMSPEQAKGRQHQIDERSDIFGLGAILFHILTGLPPATTLEEVFDQVAEKESPRPRELNSATPRPLDAICAKAMSHHRDERYTSAAAFAKELELYLNDRSVSAYVDPLTVKLGRWARRHKSVVSTAVAVALLLCVAAVASGFVYQAAIADREREIATRRTSIEQSEANGLAEIKEGRFEGGRKHFERALGLASDDASFHQEHERISAHLAATNDLLEFQEVGGLGEELGWNDQDEDAVYLIQRALAKLHVFEHWDWWAHLTPLELSPTVRHELQQRVYYDLCFLVAMRLHWGMVSFRGPIEFSMGTNKEARSQFEAALVPIAAAQRFRPGVGLDFAKALCEAQTEGFAGWTRFVRDPELSLERLTTPRELKNPVDKYFIGMSLLYYHLFSADGDDPIVELSKPFLRFDDPLPAALTMLREASAQRPDHFYTVFAYAWAAETAQDHDRALVAYSRCIVIAPDSPEAHTERALQYILLGQQTEDKDAAAEYFRRAMTDVETATGIAPSNPLVHWRRSAAVSHFPDAIPSVLDAQIKALTLMAPTEESVQFTIQRQARRAYLDPALQYANYAIDTRPDLAESWVLGAMCAWRLEDVETAKEYLDKALELWPDSPVAVTIRGEMHLAEGKLKDARNDFELAIELDDTQFLAYRGLALLALKKSESDQAIAAFTRLIEIASNDWQRFEALTGRAVASIRVGAFDQAIADTERILIYRPSSKCDQVVAAAAASGDETLVARLDEVLSSRSPEPTHPSLEVFGYAALLNGGFELPLSEYWDTTAERPAVWWNEGGCRSMIERTRTARVTGEYSLRIRNLSPKAEGVFGRMTQQVPTEPGRTYRIRFRVKSSDLAKDAFAIMHVDQAGESTELISIPGGDLDWTEFEAELFAIENTSTIELISRDQGTVWLDDLVMELVASE